MRRTLSKLIAREEILGDILSLASSSDFNRVIWRCRATLDGSGGRSEFGRR
jgi:hypothetical protein